MPALLPSELPVLARTRHHWVIMLRRPHKVLVVAVIVLLLAAVVKPDPMAWVFVIVLAIGVYLRWQTWRAEWVILTRRRVIRVRGIPETTSAESSLRVDRISGAVLEQTVLGKLLDYGTIELEAPGQHPDVRRLDTIAHPHAFYLQLRKVIFGDDTDLDIDDGLDHAVTAPLPFLPPRRPRRPG